MKLPWDLKVDPYPLPQDSNGGGCTIRGIEADHTHTTADGETASTVDFRRDLDSHGCSGHPTQVPVTIPGRNHNVGMTNKGTPTGAVIESLLVPDPPLVK